MKIATLLAFLFCSQIVTATTTIEEGFESFPTEKIGTITAPYGKWVAQGDQAVISSANVYKGARTLQFNGGQNCKVSLEFNKPLATDYVASFAIQRFTAVNPFDFQLWSIKGDKKECVFSSKTVPLKYEEISNVIVKEGTERLDFILTSPKGKGCFIDQFSMIPVGPMEILSVDCKQDIIPMLIGSKHNNLLTTIIKTKGSTNPNSILSGTYVFEGSNNDIDGFDVFHKRNGKEHFIKSVMPPEKPEFKIDLGIELGIGDNEVIIRPKLKPTASATNKMDLACLELIDAKDKIHEPITKSPAGALLVGHVLRAANQDNCHTWRIPGIVTSNKGTVLAVYDNRYNNSADLQEDVDVGLSRSTDGGLTWEPMKVIMDMKEWGGKPQRENGIGDPAILVDRKTNTIWVAALWAHGTPGKRTWFASQKGLEPSQTGQFVLVKSTDDGVTWSEPINITKQVKKYDWNLFFQGPGMGISMRDGTLVFPAQYRDANGMPFSTIIFSKDGGVTWESGVGAKANTTESQVVELNDGSLMLNMRDNRGAFRSVATTKDLGKTWVEHPTSRSALIDPICMGSIIRAKSKLDGDAEDILLFSNPHSKNSRSNMSIQVSRDDGKTWDSVNAFPYDVRNCFGYSCLTMIDKDTVGVIYEGSRDLFFLRIKLKDILEYKKK